MTWRRHPIAGLLLLAGCIVPPALEEDTRAGNNIPQFQSGMVPLPFFTATAGQTQEFSVRISDPDEQTLHIRLFVDGNYALPVNIRGRDTAPWQGTPRRTFDFDIEGLCDSLVILPFAEPHTVELYVNDSGFDDDIVDARYALPGGNWNSHLWRYQCEAAP